LPLQDTFIVDALRYNEREKEEIERRRKEGGRRERLRGRER
jgi:hypothetical protein